MTPPRDSLLSLWKEPPRPWHLLLTPAIPLLGLLKDGLWITPPIVVIAPFLIAIGVALILTILLVPLGADRHRSTLAVSLLVLAGLSYLMIVLPMLTVFSKAGVYIAYALLALTAVKLLRTHGSATAFTITANRVVAIALLLLVAPVLWSEWKRTRSPLAALPPSVRADAGRPDVYVIALDGYARHDVLREVFGFDNGLVSELRTSGFFVADRAAANYSQTALSLASALNADYIPALKPAVRSHKDRRGLGDLIDDSLFFRAFASAGYQIRAYQSEYALVHPRPAHERPSPAFYLNDFSFTVYETTILPRILEVVGLQPAMHLHRRHIEWTLQHLAQAEPRDSQPILAFAHILAPHPPFAFDANGEPRRTRMPALLHDGDMWRRLAVGKDETYKAGYLDNVRTLNARLATVVRSIAARNRKSIVLIHSDHGSGAGLDWERPDRTDIRERMSILGALRFPDGEVPPVKTDDTLVNLYRAVLNRALGTDLPMIEDRSYHSTWERPFDFIDVTDQLSGAGPRAAPAHR